MEYTTVGKERCKLLIVRTEWQAANFVKNMKTNTTLTYLDISHNLIGSQVKTLWLHRYQKVRLVLTNSAGLT